MSVTFVNNDTKGQLKWDSSEIATKTYVVLMAKVNSFQGLIYDDSCEVFWNPVTDKQHYRQT